MASEKITALIEEVKNLSVLELSELVKALEEEFGVSAAAMAAPAAAKINVIKIVREVTGLGLADAKAAGEGAPTILKEAVSKEDGEDIKAKIEAVGGKFALK